MNIQEFAKLYNQLPFYGLLLEVNLEVTFLINTDAGLVRYWDKGGTSYHTHKLVGTVQREDGLVMVTIDNRDVWENIIFDAQNEVTLED